MQSAICGKHAGRQVSVVCWCGAVIAQTWVIKPVAQLESTTQELISRQNDM